MPGLEPGREGFKMLNVMFRSAFPDVWVDVDQIVADDDKVACRWTSTGTHQGDLFGIPPTGNKVKVTATVWYRVEDGRLAEGWINRDDVGLMRQLGVIPSRRRRLGGASRRRRARGRPRSSTFRLRLTASPGDEERRRAADRLAAAFRRTAGTSSPCRGCATACRSRDEAGDRPPDRRRPRPRPRPRA